MKVRCALCLILLLASACERNGRESAKLLEIKVLPSREELHSVEVDDSIAPLVDFKGNFHFGIVMDSKMMSVTNYFPELWRVIFECGHGQQKTEVPTVLWPEF